MQLRLLYVDAEMFSKYEGGGGGEIFVLQGQPDDYSNFFYHIWYYLHLYDIQQPKKPKIVSIIIIIVFTEILS